MNRYQASQQAILKELTERLDGNRPKTGDIMGERHEMLGQRAELLPQRQRLRVECEALRDRLRGALPVHEEVDALNGENVLNTAIALQTSLAELAGLNRKIEILNSELGA